MTCLILVPFFFNQGMAHQSGDSIKDKVEGMEGILMYMYVMSGLADSYKIFKSESGGLVF